MEIETQPRVSLGTPVRLFEAGKNDIELGRLYDVGPDGRLLVVRTGAAERRYFVVVVENWLQEFEGS